MKLTLIVIICEVQLIPTKRLGLQIHLPQTKVEQGFVNSMSSYSSNWLRISLDNDIVSTDDKFHGEISFTILFFLVWNSDIVTFELWDETSFSIVGQKFQSAINIAGLYWQGFGFTRRRLRLI